MTKKKSALPKKDERRTPLGGPLHVPLPPEHSVAERLSRTFRLADPQEIGAFVYSNPGMAQLLMEAIEPLSQVFGHDVPLSLHLETDPEIQDFKQLFVYIHATLTPEEAMAKLAKFDDTWFLDQLDTVEDRLNFDVEFE